MTFTQFIKQLTSEQVNTWWQTIAPNQAPEKVEEENWKYKLIKNGKALPFKWSIAELAKHYNIPFSNKDFDSNVANRDAFCEAFDFEIQEDLVYDDNESKAFQEFYGKLGNHTFLFQQYIDYLHKIIKTNDINPYKIRFAYRKVDNEAMTIIGMRATQSFKVVNSKAILGFIVEQKVLNQIPNHLLVKSEQFTGKDKDKWLIRLEVTNWNEISPEILESNQKCFSEEYYFIKNHKRATWNTEANTTNSVLKYLTFKAENIEEWLKNNRPINYWVFQGNPKEFDIVKALEDNALKTWRVKAHKDKINKGDKVILWAGGKNSGVYALATVDSEVSKMPEPEIEREHYKDQTVYEDKERVFLKIDYNLFNQPVLKSELENYTWFSKMKVGSQGTNFTATKEEYESIKMLISKMNKLIINISWNSKDWKEESQDKSNHEWVKNGGIPFESWNFANDAEGNTDEHIFGYAKFTNNPKISGKSIFIFYSDKKIVGFYGNAAIVDKKVKDNVLNLRGDQNISFVLENKIENIVEKGYLEDGKRIGQGGFNYLHKNETVLKILEEALLLNPNQKEEILRLKEWFMKETKSNQSNENLNKSSNVPLNQILYGPPGTGKTYNSINKAIEIINPNFDLTQDRETVKKEFDRLVSEGQIIFTTFHQSMSYEDFVEGIKPIIDESEDENKQVLYNVEDGLFKQLVERAKEHKKKTIETSNLENFDESWEQLIESVRLKISNDELLKIGSWEYGLSNKDSLKYSSLNSPSKYTFTITKQNILDVYQNKKARPSGAFQKDMQDIVDFMKNKFQLKDFKEKKSEEIVVENNQKYVLIIDEINRGNISQIFGELITLIEESKRLGEVEALEVTLTYSKKKFGVPSNVYIIGTMNTADRSVEALDTALRRRFSFEEMLPSYDIKELDYFISDYKASEILNTINTRIELLLGREYVIGHSYFLDKTTKELNDIKNAIEGVKILLDSVNSRVEKDEIKIELTKLNNLLSEKETNRKRYDEINLLESFYKNIIPLLQEYFYNDFGKIGLILGKGFVRAKGFENKSKSIFADFDSRNEVDLIKTYEVVPKSEIKFNEAINLMMV